MGGKADISFEHDRVTFTITDNTKSKYSFYYVVGSNYYGAAVALCTINIGIIHLSRFISFSSPLFQTRSERYKQNLIRIQLLRLHPHRHPLLLAPDCGVNTLLALISVCFPPSLFNFTLLDFVYFYPFILFLIFVINQENQWLLAQMLQ